MRIPLLGLLMAFASGAFIVFVIWLGEILPLFINRLVKLISAVLVMPVFIYRLINEMITAIATKPITLKKVSNKEAPTELPLAAHLLRFILYSKEEYENIYGDLKEEYMQFSSSVKAYLWLHGQVFKSVLPLSYKTIKKHLLSKFKGPIR